MSDDQDTDSKPAPRVSAQRLAAQQEANDVKWLMSSEQGRRIMWRRLERAGVFRCSFTGNSTTFFNEGRRDIGLQDIGDIHAHAPEAYALMVAEAQKATK
jgi:hypothetical protein